MMGQIERSVANIIAAIDRINATLQRMSVYTSEHSVSLAADSITSAIGVGAALAGIAVETELIGTTAATTLASGSMCDFVRALAAAVAADSDITVGDLQVITELIASAGSVATAAGVLSDATILLKAVVDELATLESNLEVITTLAGASVGVTAGAAAKLWV